jgi:hypothetical protein
MDSWLKHVVKHTECLKEINSFVVTLDLGFTLHMLSQWVIQNKDNLLDRSWEVEHEYL